VTGSASPRALVWFRRDLRDFDHAALHHALREAQRVYCAFVFDNAILDELANRADRRVEFIHASVVELNDALRRRGGALIVRHGFARTEIPKLAAQLRVQAVYANRDYEPATRARDADVELQLRAAGIAFRAFKDHVIFERDELLTRSGTPFHVFTPYGKAWQAALTPASFAPLSCEGMDARFAPPPPGDADAAIPSLRRLGFVTTDLRALRIEPGMHGGAVRFSDFRKRIGRYHLTRDFPAVKGPSYLSVHLRFGTVSIRQLAGFAHACKLRPGGDGASRWLDELAWRDFYAQILWHHPRVVDEAFRTEYADLAFPSDPGRLAAWCEGRTGYPLVDAAMRQLDSTGYMHNRLRMITASFLTKDLLCDWRLGERHFSRKLIDYDLASNNGGWQWAASTGCDPQPYFRIFNPVAQSERFDADGRFIRRYCPELAPLASSEIHAPWKLPPEQQRARGVVIGRDYPLPIVDHELARREALELYGGVRRQRAVGPSAKGRLP